jgi:ankyrin repeat protein
LNFKTKCVELGFTLDYQSKEECDRLERWCHDNISLDISYSGEDKDRYISYLNVLKEYFDTFLAPQDQALDQPLPELNNRSKIEYAAIKGYHYFIMSEVPNHLIDKPNNKKMTALHWASIYGHSHTLDVLLEKGANPLLTNSWNQYPIHSSLDTSYNIDDVDLIPKKIHLFKRLQHIAPETIYEPDRSGDTVFHLMSCDDRFHELMTELLNSDTRGAFIYNNQKHYPIHCSILNNQTKSVKLLLLIDKVDSLYDINKEMALHYAARSENPEIIQACCDHSQNLNIQNNEGETPLIIAAQKKNLTAIKILVEQGAHLHEEDIHDHSFIYYAKKSHSPALIHWLEEQGIKEPARPGI